MVRYKTVVEGKLQIRRQFCSILNQENNLNIRRERNTQLQDSGCADGLLPVLESPSKRFLKISVHCKVLVTLNEQL